MASKRSPAITGLYCSQIGNEHTNRELLEVNRKKIFPSCSATTARLYEKLLGKEPDRTRKLVVPYDQVVGLGVEEKFELFQRASRELLRDASRGLLRTTGLQAKQIDILIITYMAGKTLPSLSAVVSNELGLRDDIISVTMGDMGCSSSVAAIDLASRLLRGERQPKRAMVVALEPVSALFQIGDDTGAVVGNTLFGEGCAAVLVSSFNEPCLYHIGPCQRVLLADDRGVEAISLASSSSGPMIQLSRDIPDVASEAVRINLRKLVPRLLSTDQKLKYLLTKRTPRWQRQIDHWAIHPGGGAVLRAMERGLKLCPADLAPSYRVYRERSNMSSPSVLYALDNIERAGPEAGDKVLMMSFGSGFKVNAVVLRRGSLPYHRPVQKNAVVVGGTSGIGQEITRMLRGRGYCVIAASRRVSETDGADPGYERIDGVTYLPLDVTDAASVEKFADAVWNRTFGLDLLVISSGVACQSRAVGRLDHAEIERLVGTNLTGAMLVTNALLPHVRKGGQLVMLNSLLGLIPLMGNATYCATKAGLNHFCESIRIELQRAGRKVGVHSLYPAYVDTPLLATVQSKDRTLLRPIAATRVAEQVERIIDGRPALLGGFFGGRDRMIAGVYQLLPRAFGKLVSSL